MRDHSDSGEDREGPRDGRGDDRSREDRGRGERGGPNEGRRTDTRFLQLELSQVLYGEAEDVARPAFRDLLLEAAKDRMRERFGAEIKALAELAVDELLSEVQASLEIEARIGDYNEERRPPRSRLRELLMGQRGRGAARDERADKRPRAAAARTRKKR